MTEVELKVRSVCQLQAQLRWSWSVDRRVSGRDRSEDRGREAAEGGGKGAGTPGNRAETERSAHDQGTEGADHARRGPTEESAIDANAHRTGRTNVRFRILRGLCRGGAAGRQSADHHAERGLCPQDVLTKIQVPHAQLPTEKRTTRTALATRSARYRISSICSAWSLSLYAPA